MATRMTRIKRIYADFDPACGVMAVATNCTNFHKLGHKLRLREGDKDTNEVSVQFVEICAICGQKTCATGARKSA